MPGWIDAQLAAVGLDHRASYPLLRWEQQPFVADARRGLIRKERRRFVRAVSGLLARRAAGALGGAELREGVVQATWAFASACRLSEDLQASILGPLDGRPVGPSIIKR